MLSFRHLSSYQPRPWFTEISSPSAQGSAVSIQPFLRKERGNSLDLFLISTISEHGQWDKYFTAEQTAYALARVRAAEAIPSLIEIASAAALLECRIKLREHLNATLTEAITNALIHHGASINWNRIDSTSFASVVGAGVAACIDTTPNDEILYLRFANEVATAISNARREAELPQSLLGLETHICERIDELLVYARTIALKQLCP